LNAPALDLAFGLKLIAAPSNATSFTLHSFIHPLQSAGITVVNGGASRGKPFESAASDWHEPELKVKL
jgi:hypothetical protein